MTTPTEIELDKELQIALKQRDDEAKRVAIMQKALEEIAGYDESYSTHPITVAEETLGAIAATHNNPTNPFKHIQK